MPAYAKDGKLVCHFQPAQKFKTRYATLGFSVVANLDEDAMWPVSYALTELTTAVEARFAALVQQAASGTPASRRTLPQGLSAHAREPSADGDDGDGAS